MENILYFIIFIIVLWFIYVFQEFKLVKKQLDEINNKIKK